MKTNITYSADRIINIIEKVYTKDVEKNLSSCSKSEILAKIEKNNIAMLDAMKNNDFATAQNVATENANLLPVVNSPEFSEYKAQIKDTEKDFTLIVERVFSLAQLPTEEQQTLLDVILKEAKTIKQQSENTNK
jgi:hypothetical protein